MKVKDLSKGIIVWYKNSTILGIVGVTLPKKFDDFEVEKIEGNPLDYQILAKRDKKGNYYKI